MTLPYLIINQTDHANAETVLTGWRVPKIFRFQLCKRLQILHFCMWVIFCRTSYSQKLHLPCRSHFSSLMNVIRNNWHLFKPWRLTTGQGDFILKSVQSLRYHEPWMNPRDMRLAIKSTRGSSAIPLWTLRLSHLFYLGLALWIPSSELAGIGPPPMLSSTITSATGEPLTGSLVGWLHWQCHGRLTDACVPAASQILPYWMYCPPWGWI